MTLIPALHLLSIEFLLTRPSRGVTVVVVLVHRIRQFLLTRPSRGVTCWIALVILVILFLLTRPSRGVTPVDGVQLIRT